ncbi:MAG: FAD/NAD(P)-binding oxidoreductase, partial [Hyphomicrobium sp.]
TIVEPLARITTCAGSNLFIGGVRTAEDLTHDFTALRNRGIQVLADTARDIDTARKVVKLGSGETISYDKLVVSPGIDFKLGGIAGYDEAATEVMPHAWRGGRQMLLLKRQLEDMPDGGAVVIAAPSGSYRCPPAPYERACMIAHYLKRQKPKSKIILLDAKKQFAKEVLFKKAFTTHYPNMIELHQSATVDDLSIVAADPKARSVTTKSGQTFKGAVVSIIPPQKAGAIAVTAGLVDGDWCPVDASTFGSAKVKDVYVLGDASSAGSMPKSGFAANSQAKVVADAIAAELVKAPKYPPRLRSTCWSLLARADTVKMGAAYAVKDGKIVEVNNFASAPDEPVMVRAKNTSEYLTWYGNMMADSFGKTG